MEIYLPQNIALSVSIERSKEEYIKTAEGVVFYVLDHNYCIDLFRQDSKMTVK